MYEKSWTACVLKLGSIGCLETNYQSTLRNLPEERRSWIWFLFDLLGVQLNKNKKNDGKTL